MAARFGRSPALDYLGIEDRVVAYALDDALHQRLLGAERAEYEREMARWGSKGAGSKAGIPAGQQYEDVQAELADELRDRGRVH